MKQIIDISKIQRGLNVLKGCYLIDVEIRKFKYVLTFQKPDGKKFTVNEQQILGLKRTPTDVPPANINISTRVGVGNEETPGCLEFHLSDVAKLPIYRGSVIRNDKSTAFKNRITMSIGFLNPTNQKTPNLVISVSLPLKHYEIVNKL